jgi:iron transport multicopper oxidase
MAISLSNFFIPAAFLVIFTQSTLAATVTHNWNVSWVPAQPFKDAPYYRDVMGINGQWPIPPLFVTKGDTLIINVHNGLGNETTSIHYHGIFQNGTTDMDGAAQVTQCAIQPGGSFTYNFTVCIPA